MQELSRIQHGEYALEEKVKSCRCSMEEKVTEMKNSLNYFKVGPSSISLLEISGHLNRIKKKKKKNLPFCLATKYKNFPLAHSLTFMGKYHILLSWISMSKLEATIEVKFSFLIHHLLCIKSFLCTRYYVIYFTFIYQIKYISILII